MAAKKKPIKIKNYKNIQPLGEGGMGMVYKAVHPVQTDKEVVIKTILLDNFKGASRKEAEELFKKEAELMDLQCENIVNFYDIFKEGRKYYIVMEYVNGLSLEDMIIEERHLRVDEIVLIFLNMLKGLDFIHTKGLVHKDIKPANFLISTEGEVKISDFGIGGADYYKKINNSRNEIKSLLKANKNNLKKINKNKKAVNELKQKITVTQKDKNRLEKEHRVIARSKQEKKIRKKELFKRKITNIDFHIERYNKKIVDNEHNINELSEEISANTDRIEKLNQDINSFQEKIKENIENMAGTPGYMAPELLAEADSKKARDASVSSDIYAMGIVLYIMLTGEKPVNGRLVRPQIVPNWLWHMIKKMLRKNPRHRYKSTDPVIRLLKKKIVLKNQMAQRAIIKQAVVDIKEKTKFSAERTAQSTAISGMTARGTVMAEAPDRTAMATMAKTAVEPAGGTVRSEIKKIKQRVLTSDSSIVKVFTLKQKRRRLLVKLAVFFILAGLLVWEFNSGHISSNIPVLNNAFSRIKVNINLGRVNLNSKEVVYLKLYYFYNPYTPDKVREVFREDKWAQLDMPPSLKYKKLVLTMDNNRFLKKKHVFPLLFKKKYPLRYKTLSRKVLNIANSFVKMGGFYIERDKQHNLCFKKILYKGPGYYTFHLVVNRHCYTIFKRIDSLDKTAVNHINFNVGSTLHKQTGIRPHLNYYLSLSDGRQYKMEKGRIIKVFVRSFPYKKGLGYELDSFLKEHSINTNYVTFFDFLLKYNPDEDIWYETEQGREVISEVSIQQARMVPFKGNFLRQNPDITIFFNTKF